MSLIRLIPDKDCDLIYNYLKNNTSGTFLKGNIRPWFENNNIILDDIKDREINKLIQNYTLKLSIMVSLKYKEIIYPAFADLVLWNKGKSMEAHIDNRLDYLKHRYISAVTYLNNDFEGGNTFVGKKSYTPKKGFTLIFKSDNLHGVTEIIKGQRGILATWFTKDFKKINED